MAVGSSSLRYSQSCAQASRDHADTVVVQTVNDADWGSDEAYLYDSFGTRREIFESRFAPPSLQERKLATRPPSFEARRSASFIVRWPRRHCQTARTSCQLCSHGSRLGQFAALQCRVHRLDGSGQYYCLRYSQAIRRNLVGHRRGGVWSTCGHVELGRASPAGRHRRIAATPI
jgi:hypothetical protein